MIVHQLENIIYFIMRPKKQQYFIRTQRIHTLFQFYHSCIYFIIRYIIEGDVVYLTLCEKSYPKKLAFTFLEELQKEFDTSYSSEVAAAKRPYAFIKFGIPLSFFFYLCFKFIVLFLFIAILFILLLFFFRTHIAS